MTASVPKPRRLQTDCRHSLHSETVIYVGREWSALSVEEWRPRWPPLWGHSTNLLKRGRRPEKMTLQTIDNKSVLSSKDSLESRFNQTYALRRGKKLDFVFSVTVEFCCNTWLQVRDKTFFGQF
jgi:hypothetical protein